MKVVLKVACLLLLSIPYTALALDCYKCSSTKSWEECDTRRVSCTGSAVFCYKVHYSTKDKTIQQFSKSCGPTSYCLKTSNPVCKDHLDPSDCEIHCCNEDMCNAGSLAGASGLVVLSSILVATMSLYR